MDTYLITHGRGHNYELQRRMKIGAIIIIK